MTSLWTVPVEADEGDEHLIREVEADGRESAKQSVESDGHVVVGTPYPDVESDDGQGTFEDVEVDGVVENDEAQTYGSDNVEDLQFRGGGKAPVEESSGDDYVGTEPSEAVEMNSSAEELMGSDVTPRQLDDGLEPVITESDE